ncbi:MAG TPA: adenosylcobinamide-phosphate synthase CbiB [Thermodesulfobacteriota bacterium]|nr:adenosylcobinamide-phosphate synthase CbiB [Thermodesulfobacteriota bacterium]
MLKLINPIPFPPLVLILAYALDLLFGDPERMPHPVRWIGAAAGFGEKMLRPLAKTTRSERISGAALAVLTTVGVWLVAYLALYYSYRYSFVLFFVLSVWMVWTSLSIKSLKGEAEGVLKALKTDGLAAARERVSRIVGRDTKDLTEEGVLRATVETVAENTSDGVVAPLFFLAVGGPPMMLAYKAVNTLDSMVGYKNEKYLHFGWFSARLDDAANYVPARLSGLLIAASAFILGYNWTVSIKTMVADGRKHPSPNSGYPEAAVAGAIGVPLGGPSSYSGVVSEKPLIGRGQAPLDPQAVEKTIKLMWTSGAIMVFFAFTARIVVLFAAR